MTLFLAAAVVALIALPAVAFVAAPAFLEEQATEYDLGPLALYDEGEFVVASFTPEPDGNALRRTVFVRNNGFARGQPSLTTLSSRSSFDGCPVFPTGLYEGVAPTYRDVALLRVQRPSGFGSNCHDIAYDTEGVRTEGRSVRPLDRHSFSIRDGHLFVGSPFRVSRIDGTGAAAKIHKL